MRILTLFFLLGGVSGSSAAEQGPCVVDVLAVQVDPRDHNVFYAETRYDGLLKSTDSGQTWIPLTDPLVSPFDLLFDPSAPSTIYVATYGQYVFKSSDNGKSWQRTSRGLVQPPCSGLPCVNTPLFYALAADPGAPSTLYALAEATAGSLYRTRDGGWNWAKVDFSLTGEQWTATAIAVVGAPSSTIYVAAGGPPDQYAIFRSTDHGVTWSATVEAPPTQVFSLTSDPSDRAVLYAATTRGVYKSTDAGEHWRSASVGLPIRQPYDFPVLQIVADKKAPGTLYAATDAFGIFKSGDHGETWLAVGQALGAAAVYSITIDPLDSSALWAATSAGLYRSTDVGASWKQSLDLGQTPTILGTYPETIHIGETSCSSSDGSSGFLLMVIGQGFAPGAAVYWNGVSRHTTSLSCTKLYVSVPSEDFAAPGVASIQVVNPDGSRSDPLPFQIQPSLPPFRFPIRVFGPVRPKRGPPVILPRP